MPHRFECARRSKRAQRTQRTQRNRWVPALFLAGCALLGTMCGPAKSPEAPRTGTRTREVASNVTRDDYAGSAVCEPCHADVYAAWQGSAMHQMTRAAKDARIEAPFDGTVFHFKDDTARLDRANGERIVAITSPKYGNKTYRVTKVIGGHHREDFAGVDTNAPGSPSGEGRGGGTPQEELVLPVSYVYATKSLRYKGYSVMLQERGGMRAGPVWQKTCIFCHNTAPYLSSILGELAGPGARGYQGEVVDRLLPANKRWAFEVTDTSAFGRALAKEVDVLHGGTFDGSSPPQMAARALTATRENFGERHLVEVGIGCESCHGGSKEHVADPRVHPSFEPRASFLRTSHPSDAAPTRATLISRTCARCHQVLFSGYPYTWEGGLRARDPGGSNINSGEARDSLLGSCGAPCVLCHDPHTRESGGRTHGIDAAPGEGPNGNALCTSCHAKLADREALRAHAQHDPAGAGGRCIACHMPKKNMSLDGTLTRYHRIGSPTDPARIEGDRPIECALCHTNKTVAAVLSDIRRLYGPRLHQRQYDEGRLRALYPDWNQNALLATLELGKPHEQAVAITLLGEAKVRAAVPQIAQRMVHPYPILRGYAERALVSILGTSSPVDLNQDDAHIEGDVRAWIQSRASTE